MSRFPPGRAAAALAALAGVWMLTFGGGILRGAAAEAAPAPARGELLRARIASIVHPVAAEFLLEAIAEADRSNAAALVVELDTPGGLMTSTREMTTAMLGARTPIVVWVAPDGAQAASAGFFLLQAGDFAVMAPATNTGAAHPVGAGGETIEGVMGKKTEEDASATIRALAARKGRNVDLAAAAVVESRSFTAREALDAALIDEVAGSLSELVAALDGREFEKPQGTKRRLEIAGSIVREIEMPLLKRFLSRIAHPNLAGILLTIGMLGIYFELSHPGAVLPGVVGGICLLLAFFALSLLPVNYVGVALVVLAVVLFIAEVKVTSYGVLGVGGIISLVLGLAMLFRTPEPALRVSTSLIATLAVVAALVVAGGVLLVSRAFRNPVTTGAEGLIGARTLARTALAPSGKVFVEGEWWNAVADGEVAAGEPVEIVAVEGMTLRVRRAAERS
jgi:membrane-bound serine protease (ClpP class)